MTLWDIRLADRQSSWQKHLSPGRGRKSWKKKLDESRSWTAVIVFSAPRANCSIPAQKKKKKVALRINNNSRTGDKAKACKLVVQPLNSRRRAVCTHLASPTILINIHALAIKKTFLQSFFFSHPALRLSSIQCRSCLVRISLCELETSAVPFWMIPVHYSRGFQSCRWPDWIKLYI